MTLSDFSQRAHAAILTLKQAAERFDGGRRSFPIPSDEAIQLAYSYEPPNQDYERLFFRQVALPGSQQDISVGPYSAGWVVPDRDSVCKPVFIAHSTLSAIWLLRETLPELPEEVWVHLVHAAEDLSTGGEQPPLSAQRSIESYSPLPRRKRTSSPSSPQSPSLKCARLEPTALQSTVDAEVQSPNSTSEFKDPDEHLPGPLQLVVTTTNNNRRAERTRHKKLEEVRLKKRVALGLVAPPEKAPRQEQAAYASISRQDEPVVAWIIKQPLSDDIDFYNASRNPYHTASLLLERARVLGDPASRYNTLQFLQAWRERGSPFRGNGRRVETLLTQLTQTQHHADQLDRAFCFAWSMCSSTEEHLAAVHIEYRWAAALLGRAYEMKIAQIRHDDSVSSSDTSRNRYGKGLVRTEAISALIQLVKSNPTDTDKLIFRKRLTKATRWYTLCKGLGWGILTLIPHDGIPVTWIEHTLRNAELDLWVKLVKRESPDVYNASLALETWLGLDAIAGGPIANKELLSIEADALRTLYEVEEVQDSEDSDRSDKEEASQDTHTLPSRLRQMTLLELFHPTS